MQGLSRRKLILSGLLALGLTAGLVFFIDWREVMRRLAAADWRRLTAAAGLLLAGYIVYAARWRYFLHGRPQFVATFHTSNVGNLANTLLPLRPGDPMRAFILRSASGLSILQITSSLVVERWFEQVMRLAALSGAFAFGSGWAVSPGTLAGLVGLLLGSYVLMLWMVHRQEFVLARLPRWLARLPRVSEERAHIGLIHLIEGFTSLSSPGRMLGGLLGSLATWALFGGFHYLCLLALYPALDGRGGLAIALGSLALAPPSASTLPGMYQVSIVLPLAVLGYDRNLLTSYTLVMNLIEMLLMSLLGVWGALRVGLSLDEILSLAGRQK